MTSMKSSGKDANISQCSWIRQGGSGDHRCGVGECSSYFPFLPLSANRDVWGCSWKGDHCHVVFCVATSRFWVIHRWWVCRREEPTASFRRTFLLFVELNGVLSFQGNERKLVQASSFPTRHWKQSTPSLNLFSPLVSEGKTLKIKPKGKK